MGKPVFGDAKGEFFSRVRGRKFAFESYEIVEEPDTRHGKWAMSLMAVEVQNGINNLEE